MCRYGCVYYIIVCMKPQASMALMQLIKSNIHYIILLALERILTYIFLQSLLLPIAAHVCMVLHDENVYCTSMDMFV